MLKEKHVNVKKLFIIFYATTVQSTWGLKECKSRKYLYDLFLMQVKGNKLANLNMQCTI
jgi:hypothetical protein